MILFSIQFLITFLKIYFLFFILFLVVPHIALVYNGFKIFER